jgi:hypothetical protein
MLNTHGLRQQFKRERELLGYEPRSLFNGATMAIGGLIVLLMTLCIVFISGCAQAQGVDFGNINPISVNHNEVDMAIIAEIESDNNDHAFNQGSGAIGLCQITPIVLKEYNQIWNKNFDRQYLFNGQFNLQVADWYMNHRIPYLLKHFNQPDTLENRLLAYNAGIRAVIKHRMPKESRNYIIKYKRLAKGATN